jgi:hypothetical protein
VESGKKIRVLHGIPGTIDIRKAADDAEAAKHHIQFFTLLS